MSAYPQDRWAWIEIDLSAVRHNVKAFKAQLSRGVKMMCVVKADAYGHGAAHSSSYFPKYNDVLLFHLQNDHIFQYA